MKTIIIIFTIILYAYTIDAQESTKKSIETARFKVFGVCGSCKTRIETAALIKGVKHAEWNKNKQILTIIYRTDKVKVEDVHKAVAQVGHDTELVKADDTVYKKLPKCCAYRDNVETH